MEVTMAIRREFGILAGILVVAVALGCATVGRDFPAGKVNEIKNGQTSKSDVFNLFGSPFQKGVEDGQLTWTYTYNKYSIGGETKTRTLKIRFDNQDRVASYSYDSNFSNEILE